MNYLETAEPLTADDIESLKSDRVGSIFGCLFCLTVALAAVYWAVTGTHSDAQPVANFAAFFATVVCLFSFSNLHRFNKDLRSGTKRVVRGAIRFKGIQEEKDSTFYFLELDYRKFKVSEFVFNSYNSGDVVEVHLAHHSGTIFRELSSCLMPLPSLNTSFTRRETTELMSKREIKVISRTIYLLAIGKTLLMLVSFVVAYILAYMALRVVFREPAAFKIWSAVVLAGVCWIPTLINTRKKIISQFANPVKKIISAKVRNMFKNTLKTTEGDITIPARSFDKIKPGDEILIHRSIDPDELLRVETAGGLVIWQP